MGISIIIWPQQHHSPFLFPFNFDSFTPLSSKKRLWQYKHGTVPPCKIKLLFPLTGHSKFTPDDALISTRTDMFSYSWVIDLLKCCCGHLIRSPPWLKILFVNIRTLARLLLVPTNYCQNGMPECIHCYSMLQKCHGKTIFIHLFIEGTHQLVPTWNMMLSIWDSFLKVFVSWCPDGRDI